VTIIYKCCIFNQFVFSHVERIRRGQFGNKKLHLSHLIQLTIEGLDNEIRHLGELLNCVICVLFLVCVLKVEARGTEQLHAVEAVQSISLAKLRFRVDIETDVSILLLLRFARLFRRRRLNRFFQGAVNSWNLILLLNS